MWRQSIASCLAVVVLSAAAPALAQRQTRRIVVQRFGGPQSSSVRAQLLANLLEQPGIEVVDDEEVRVARERLNFGTRIRGDQYVQLARALRVSAFIDGMVSRRRRHWAVTVRVRNGADGEELGAASWGGRTAAALNGVRRGYGRIQPYIEGSSVPGAAPAATNDGEEAPWYAQQEEEEERPPGDGEEESPTPEPTPPPTGPQTRYDALRVAVVGGFLYRWMEATATVYASQRGMAPPDPASALVDEPRNYSGFVPLDLGLSAEVYPGAFGDSQVFPYLGLVFNVTHSLLAQAKGRDAATGEPVGVGVDQLELFVGARGRYRIGAERREPEIFAEAGYGIFEFLLGTTQLQQIERRTIVAPYSVGYLQLRAGVSYGIIPTYLTVSADLGARIGTNIGADTRNVWGVDTSPSNGFLMGVEVRTEIPEIVRGAFVALRLSYFMFATTYRGQVGCAESGGCSGYVDPWADTRLWELWPVQAPAPGGVADLNALVGGIQNGVNDNYFRLQLQAGWSFY